MIYPRGSFTGNYEPRGNVAEADCVIGNEFAYRETGFGSVNEQLAEFIAERYTNLALFLNKNIAGALNVLRPDIEPDETFVGEPVNYMGTRGIGTKGELLQAKKFMADRQLERPIIVAQAYHVGRVAIQAKWLGINPIISEGLPKDFDSESVQSWTQGPLAWAWRESRANPALRVGHIIDKLRP